MKKPSSPSILPLPKPPTTIIVAAVIGTVVLSNLTVPTNGQIRRLRTHRLSHHGRGFGRSIAAREVRGEKDPSRPRRKLEIDFRRRERASVEDPGRDSDETMTKPQQKPRRKEKEKMQRRNLQPLFVDDDGIAMDGDFIDDNRYEYEYDFDYVISEGTLPDDATSIFDDNLATPSIFDDGTANVPDLPPAFPFPAEEGVGGVAIVSTPPLDFSFSFPDSDNVPFLDGNGNSEDAESGLFAPGLDEDNEEVSTMPSPANDPNQDSFFETTAIDSEEDTFWGLPSLSMSFGMPSSDDDHYSMSMSMPWTVEPSITPPATEPPSSPPPSASPTGLRPTQSPSYFPSYSPSFHPSLSPSSEAPTPFMGLSMDYDMSMSMNYEMSIGAASGSDDGDETNDTGISMDDDDGGSMRMSMSMSMSIPMPTKPSTSQTTPSPTLLVQDLPYIPTRPTDGDGDGTDSGNGGLIPAEGSTSTNAPTWTGGGGGAVGDGETRAPSFYPTTAFPTEESFGRAVPATGPTSPSSSSFGMTSFGMRFVWVLIGIEGLRMILVV
mmetsp:Transcript_22369/g.45346  ORF Transcript_22369/g.45346 Transcript_22369/m.45346 type:complete len:548 (-) Transcript_22369:86-1729(-)